MEWNQVKENRNSEQSKLFSKIYKVDRNRKNNREKEMKWLSWEELKLKYGEEESKQRVKAGTCFARRDPNDQRFWQFLAETESQKLSIDQQKDLQVQNSGSIKGTHFKALSNVRQQRLMEQ